MRPDTLPGIGRYTATSNPTMRRGARTRPLSLCIPLCDSPQPAQRPRRLIPAPPCLRLALAFAILLAAFTTPVLCADPHQKQDADGGRVRLLTFGTEEMALIRLPGGVFIWPETELLEGDKPRIILDFNGVEGWDEAYSPDGGGTIVKRIRTYLHEDEKRLRVVLDLARNPSNYAITLNYEERVHGTEITVSAIPLRKSR